MQKRFLHINYGTGKGKSTAGYGLCLRAYGRGKKVLVICFLKPFESGEVAAIKKLISDGGIEIKNFEPPHGFIKTAAEAEFLKESAVKAVDFFEKAAQSQKYGMIFLDELTDAVNLGLVSAEKFIEIYGKCTCDVVISGRNPNKKLLEVADYITEYKSEKHPFDCGIMAREGVEY